MDTLILANAVLFLSTLSLRRATGLGVGLYLVTEISIHALLAESDPPVREIVQWEGIFLSTLSLRRATNGHETTPNRVGYFYPRSPCGERQAIRVKSREYATFLSTLSLRRATADVVSVQHGRQNFYPRSPCGERQLQNLGPLGDHYISIHALLAESDRMCSRQATRRARFLSTLSLRRATYFCGAAL